MSTDGREEGGISGLTHRADLAQLSARAHSTGLNSTMSDQEAQKRQGECLAAQPYCHGRGIC